MLSITHKYLKVFHSAFKVKATGFGVIIAVLLDLHANMLENWQVVAPGWSGHPNSLGREELGQEGRAYSERSSARYSLHSGIASALQDLTVFTQSQTSGCLTEGWRARDGGILLVQTLGHHDGFSLCGSQQQNIINLIMHTKINS